jgi:hypothetical protein
MASRVGPVIVQLVVTYLVIAWVVRLVRRARKSSTRAAAPTAAAGTEPPQTTGPGGVRRTQVLFNDLVWQATLRPRRGGASGRPEQSLPPEAYVDEPPRCPKCGLGVEETHSWLGYTWRCPECGLRRRSRSSIHETAEFLARRQ